MMNKNRTEKLSEAHYVQKMCYCNGDIARDTVCEVFSLSSESHHNSQLHKNSMKMNSKTNKETFAGTREKNHSQKHSLPVRRSFLRSGSRIASIAVTVCTSIAAAAEGITPEVTAPNEINAPTGTDKTITAPIMFEDESLETIMKKVADTYNVRIRFDNGQTATLHLYYKLDTALSLDEIVSQLNTFEQINIELNGNTLTIY